MKRILCGILVFCFYLSMDTISFALGADYVDTDSAVFLESSTDDVRGMFNDMSNNELNAFVDMIAKSYQEIEFDNSNSLTSTAPSSETYLPRLTWLAAAQVLRNSGYPCTAVLIESSVTAFPYQEDLSISGGKGLFQEKISTTSIHRDYVSKLKSSAFVPNSLAFTKSINSDLFYSLHRVNISYSKIGTGALASYSITISDVYDFAYDNGYYDDLFTTLINNWGWLSQKTNLLHPISVTIRFLEI